VRKLAPKAGFISVYTDGIYKRYFQSKTFTENDMEIISLLRDGIIRKHIISSIQKRSNDT
jgi:hypothetical protein